MVNNEIKITNKSYDSETAQEGKLGEHLKGLFSTLMC